MDGSNKGEFTNIGQGELFADVHYFGIIYWDAKLVGGVWHYDDTVGNDRAFDFQNRVRVLNEPLPYRRMRR